jgi:hypothetical protein
LMNCMNELVALLKIFRAKKLKFISINLLAS